MLRLRAELGLSQEALAHERIHPIAFVQNLDGDIAAERVVAGTVDGAIAPWEIGARTVYRPPARVPPPRCGARAVGN